MYYLVDNDEELRYESIDDVVDYCVTTEYYEDDTEGFDEYLDQDGQVEVRGYDFYPSEILRELNAEAYHRELSDWAEEQVDYHKEDAEYELENAAPGSSVWICGYRVYVYDEDEEEDEEASEELNKMALKLLEERLVRQKQEEQMAMEAEKEAEDNFLATLGIQVI